MSKILLVEDDNNLREIYEARLQAEGYQIVSARDGEEALVVAKAEKPDLIISDIMMPKISGFEMLDIMRNTEELKHVKVIMLTALGQSDDQQRADKLGADRYLVKSQVTLEDIVKAARDLLDEESDAAPAVDGATSEPTPVSDDKLMNDVVNELVADTEKKDQSLKKPSAKATTIPTIKMDKMKATSTVKQEEEPENKEVDAPSGEDDASDDKVHVSHKKIIKPIESKPKKDLETLLAEEEAKENGTAVASPSDAGKPVSPAEPTEAEEAVVEAAKSSQDAISTRAEEASMDAKIEDFVAGASTEPTTPVTPPPADAPKAVESPDTETKERPPDPDPNKIAL